MENTRNQILELQGQIKDAEKLTKAEVQKRKKAEEDAAKAWSEFNAALELAQLTEEKAQQEIALYEKELQGLQKEGAKKTEKEYQQTIAFSRTAASQVDLTEADTRRLIDQQLRAAGWEGEKAKTIEVANTLLKFGREHGDYRSKGMGYCCLGWSELIEGDVAEATRFFEKAVQISLDPWYSVFPKLALAYGLILNGKVHEARRNIIKIEKFCDEFGVEFAGKPACFFRGVVLVGEGRTNEGLHILEESCEQWMQNGSKLRFAACGSMLAAVYSRERIIATGELKADVLR